MPKPTPRQLPTHRPLDRGKRDAITKRGNATSSGQLVAKSKTPDSQSQQGNWTWIATLITIGVISGAAGLVVGGGWVGLELILNADGVNRVNQFLPDWAKISLRNQHPPQTIAQIRANLTKEGQIPGENLTLETNPQTLEVKSLLLPVLASQPDCQTDCQQIVELQVYQLAAIEKGESYYQLVSQLPITGPEESFAIAPVTDADTPNQGSTHVLPLTEVHRFEGKTPSGFWFYLQGKRVRGSTTITYGQIVHYNPTRTHLQVMLPWTTANGQIPQWQKVTGGNSPDLVVDQTVDLEPQLHVYQVKPVDFFLDPIQLEEISLAEPALSEPAYDNSLVLARSGLWSPAWQWLQLMKRQHQGRLPEAASAQISLTQLYAQITKSQADKTWSSPSQQVLAVLIDGRWNQGLQVFQWATFASRKGSTTALQEITALLQTDSGRLWNRVEAALRVNPGREEVLTWGAIILSAQQGQQAALEWLREQPKITPVILANIQPLLDQLEGKDTTVNTVTTHPSRIVGTATPIAQFNPSEWLQPDQNLGVQLENRQWYQVQVVAFHDGKGWQQAPFVKLMAASGTSTKAELGKPTTANLGLAKTTPGHANNTATFLWHQLGLDTNSQLQLVVWSPDGQEETTTANVKAVQLQGGVLRLLAEGSEPISESKKPNLTQPFLAITDAALQWVQPTPITLDELRQQQPLKMKVILPLLWQELQKSGCLSPNPTPNLDQMQQLVGNWPVQLTNLTGNPQPEIVLTVSPQAIATLNPRGICYDTRSHTLILSSTGRLLYSEFSDKSRTIKAIANLGDNQLPVLLVEGAQSYSLQRWNQRNQRFDE